jgi:hypothetical protein
MLVNDEERTMVASLIDCSFVVALTKPSVSQLALSSTPPLTTSGMVHPLLLSVALLAPAWCLSLRVANRVGMGWDEVVAFHSTRAQEAQQQQQQQQQRQSSASSLLVAPATLETLQLGARNMAAVAACFNMGPLASVLSRLGAGEYHRASREAAQLHGQSQQHAPFLADLLPAVMEALATDVVVPLAHALLDAMHALGSWLPSPPPLSSSNNAQMQATNHMASPRRRSGGRGKKQKQNSPPGLLARIFSSKKKRKSGGNNRRSSAGHRLAAAQATVMDAVATSSVPISPFHAHAHSILFELLSGLLCRSRWESVDVAAIALGASSYRVAAGTAPVVFGAPIAPAKPAPVASEAVQKLFGRFVALAAWPHLHERVLETLFTFVSAAQGHGGPSSALSPTRRERHRAHSTAAQLLVAGDNARAQYHKQPPRKSARKSTAPRSALASPIPSALPSNSLHPPSASVQGRPPSARRRSGGGGRRSVAPAVSSSTAVAAAAIQEAASMLKTPNRAGAGASSSHHQARSPSLQLSPRKSVGFSPQLVSSSPATRSAASPSFGPALPPPVLLFGAGSVVNEDDERGTDAAAAHSSNNGHHPHDDSVATELVPLNNINNNHTTAPLPSQQFSSYTYTITPPDEEEEDKDSIRIIQTEEEAHAEEEAMHKNDASPSARTKQQRPQPQLQHTPQHSSHQQHHQRIPSSLALESRALNHANGGDSRPHVDIYASRQLQQSLPERNGQYGTGDGSSLPSSNSSTLTSSSTLSRSSRRFDSATNGEELRAQVQAAMKERARSKDLLQAREQAMLARLNRRKPTAAAAVVPANKENQSSSASTASLVQGGGSSSSDGAFSSSTVARLEELRAKMMLRAKPSVPLPSSSSSNSQHQQQHTPPLSPNSRLQNSAAAAAATASSSRSHYRQNSYPS